MRVQPVQVRWTPPWTLAIGCRIRLAVTFELPRALCGSVDRERAARVRIRAMVAAGLSEVSGSIDGMKPPNKTLNLSSAGDALTLKVKREAERLGIPLEAAILHV